MPPREEHLIAHVQHMSEQVEKIGKCKEYGIP